MESEEGWPNYNGKHWIPIWCVCCQVLGYVWYAWFSLVGELQRQFSTQFEVRRVEEPQKAGVSSSDDVTGQLQVIIPRDLQAETHMHLYVSQDSG